MNFLPQGSYFMKVIKKKTFSKRKCNVLYVKKNAHGFEPIKLLCIYIYVPTILYWLDLPQKNSSSWQNLVENLHQDKLKHLNCWQFIHNFSKPFFFLSFMCDAMVFNL